METPAIDEINNPEDVRVQIFVNGMAVHVPLEALLKALSDRIDALDSRVTALETP